MRIRQYSIKEFGEYTGLQTEDIAWSYGTGIKKFYCAETENGQMIGETVGAEMQDGTFNAYGCRDYENISKEEMIEMIMADVDEW